MDKISVIIRNKNEQEHIGLAIQSVIDHFDNPEIIIVDNNSTDDSLNIVNLFIPHHNIKLVNIKNYSPGASLNLGVKECNNNTLLILSAHSQITKMNLQLVKEKLVDNMAVFGKQIPIYRGKKINRRYIWSHFGENEQTNMFSSIEKRPFLHNAFCFYRKSILSNFPFNETYSSKEDRYWAIDILEKGFKYLYTPELEVNHYWTPNGATWKGIG
jgi:glycosyltransferase involved in cell wall biosynthesis|tara:strand:- start:190 stop:831 length:642 start_codon:yes stop_codon:yes gene_type:complete